MRAGGRRWERGANNVLLAMLDDRACDITVEAAAVLLSFTFTRLYTDGLGAGWV